MKKIIYTGLITLSSIIGINAQTVSYKVTEDDPYDIKNFTASIDPLFIDVNGMNGYSAGWGIRSEYTYAKKFSASFDFRNGFGTNGFDPDDKNTHNYSAIEGKIGLCLMDKAKMKNFQIILSQSSYTSGGVTYTSKKYFWCPGTSRKMIFFNAGIYQLSNNFKYSQHQYDSTNQKGISFENSGVKSRKGDSLWNKYDFSSKYGGFYSTSITAGFTFRTIHNLFVDVDGWGGRSNSIFSDFYIDAMFAPIMGLRDYQDTATGKEFNVRAENKRLFGWRMGWFIRRPKNQGFSQKFEFGQRPGIKTDSYLAGCYLMYTFGLYIPLRVGPHE